MVRLWPQPDHTFPFQPSPYESHMLSVHVPGGTACVAEYGAPPAMGVARPSQESDQEIPSCHEPPLQVTAEVAAASAGSEAASAAAGSDVMAAWHAVPGKHPSAVSSSTTRARPLASPAGRRAVRDGGGRVAHSSAGGPRSGRARVKAGMVRPVWCTGPLATTEASFAAPYMSVARKASSVRPRTRLVMPAEN